ncbi:IclR family transcriptional regulator [Pseudarthrobacter sulfonivorans]|uniref:IclR family transcriptional regulator n=1 Tax=Pseudarthrobacter sulfonivorans TaxID=121292 RepID=UPI00286726E8|nr:IclR family transcriptional regulator [Pseudarthrobacter sulfonivorans]MDR6414488.1 DNA-binding IclR family transcriptional regulator [Pseudarthrobacter sulfonivorans]
MKKRNLARIMNAATPAVPATSRKKRDERGTAMSILLLFARHSSLSSAQISGLLRLPTTIVYRHLQTLLQAGFVVESQVIGRYSAGPEVVRLADNYRQEALAQGAVARRLERLSGDTGELAAYLVQSSNEVLCVESVESAHILSCSYAAGRSRPLLHGASARAILAHLPEEETNEILANHSVGRDVEHTIRAELAEIRRRGYATSSGALAPGVWGVSAPVFGDAGSLAGVVTTMVPLERPAAESERTRLVKSTCQAALDLSQLAAERNEVGAEA